MKYIFISVTLILCFFLFDHEVLAEEKDTTWNFQSVDTMKFSRDMARAKLKDPSFDAVIDMQVKSIAHTGATHIAIATPYDEEFIPYLRRWVKAARKYDLKVWFRGNFSGWEEWFEYKPITRTQHIAKTKLFIEKNPGLFEDGDVFTACPECENGGPGDPRENDDVKGHRKFLIQEYQTTANAFQKIGKDVASNYNSMNGDVAELVMDKATTKALGGIVVVDHYVKTPEELARDIRGYAVISGGKVILGEFGAPIPDIHGEFTLEQQDEWLAETLKQLAYMPELVGMNYWTFSDSSTQLWTREGQPHPAASTLQSFYSAKVVRGKVVDELNNPAGGVRIKAMGRETMSDDAGEFRLPYLTPGTTVIVKSKGYKEEIVKVASSSSTLQIQLTKKEEAWWFKAFKAIKNLFETEFTLKI